MAPLSRTFFGSLEIRVFFNLLVRLYFFDDTARPGMLTFCQVGVQTNVTIFPRESVSS